MKKISILGSTGFIGTSTLKIIAAFPDRFKVVGLAAGKNIDRLSQQIQSFKPELVSVSDKVWSEKLKELIPANIPVRILSNQSGMIKVATHPEADLVVSAMVGSVGLIPTMAAIKSGKRVALANKETLIVAGRLVMEEARARGVEIIPIDSEHSAIFQALKGNKKEDVSRIILTASGGPFLNLDPKASANITPEEALRHPVWEMGKKITIDSATLMNKGLEIIEAHWLFGFPPEDIKVVIHPQSIIHSMVEYCDGSIIAQMSIPDMRIPISYALMYPERLKAELPSLSLAEVGKLTFIQPNEEQFPALKLAYQALREEESLSAVLNGANEVAVEAFLQKRITFPDILSVIERTMDCHTPQKLRDITESIEINTWAQKTARKIIDSMKR
jgi:1-deoxy-D-xylulose-5-phosphate reductoisomerase